MTMTCFRAAFLVSPEDAAKAEGDVKADVRPASKVLNFICLGRYPTLRGSHDVMINYLEANAMTFGAPTWAIYLNDPDSIESE
jgi:effector-binding domain-containing protein